MSCCISAFLLPVTEITRRCRDADCLSTQCIYMRRWFLPKLCNRALMSSKVRDTPSFLVLLFRRLSGIAAMVWSVRPDMTAADVRECIIRTATKVRSLDNRVLAAGKPTRLEGCTLRTPSPSAARTVGQSVAAEPELFKEVQDKPIRSTP